jgi:hypothetical protein
MAFQSRFLAREIAPGNFCGQTVEDYPAESA